MAKAGADVAIIDLAVKNLEKTKEMCEAEGVKVVPYACDVTKDQIVKDTVQQIEKDLGPIYVVVNNAGGVSTRPFHMETMERFWYMIELNFKAVYIAENPTDDRRCYSPTMSFLVCVSVKRAALSALYFRQMYS